MYSPRQRKSWMCAKPQATTTMMMKTGCVRSPGRRWTVIVLSLVDGWWSMEITDARDPVHSMNGCRMRNGLQLTQLKRCISELSGGVGLCPAGMFCQHNILVFADSLLRQMKVPRHGVHKIEMRDRNTVHASAPCYLPAQVRRALAVGR